MHGQQVLTLTNAEGDIYCSSNGKSASNLIHHIPHKISLYLTTSHYPTESQLLATHMVTVRYMSENPHTEAHRDRVRIYNADLWKKIKPKPLIAPAPSSTVSTVGVWLDATHYYYKVGYLLRVNYPFHPKYKPLVGQQGEIRKIMSKTTAGGKVDYIFFVQLRGDTDDETASLHETVRDLNKRCFSQMLSRDERSLLPCKPSHVSTILYYTFKAPQQGSSVPASDKEGGSSASKNDGEGDSKDSGDSKREGDAKNDGEGDASPRPAKTKRRLEMSPSNSNDARHAKYDLTAKAPWHGGEVKPFLYGRRVVFVLEGKRGEPITR